MNNLVSNGTSFIALVICTMLTYTSLLAHKDSDLLVMSEALKRNAQTTGLKVNAAKNKIMRNTHASSENINEVPFEVVGHFTYLGSVISPNGGAELDAVSRINKARAAFGALAPLWNSNKISRKTKLRFFNSNVKSVLLYACETWKIKDELVSKIQSFINKCLRRILRIHWPQIISNTDLWRKTRQVPVDVEIRRRKWGWIGHTLRKPHDEISRQALDWNPQGSRRVGRPNESWRRTVENEIKLQRKTWKEVKRMATNRDQWRGFVDALCPATGVRGH